MVRVPPCIFVPLLIGTGAEVGVKPAKEYLFMVFVTPVGPYFKEGFKPVDVMICRSHDRAAPLGTGCFKVGGNYAASLTSLEIAHQHGISPLPCTWMPRKKNTLMRQVRPIFSASERIPI